MTKTANSQVRQQKKSTQKNNSPGKETNGLAEDGFRLCRALTAKNKPIMGEPPRQVSREMAPLEIFYQCAGPAYDRFGDELHALVKRTASKRKTPPLWGRRPEPIPPHEKTTTTETPPTFVLFLGSDHLRQIATAFLCQYSDLVTSVRQIYQSKNRVVQSHYWEILLQSNVHVFVVINPALVYHDSWQELLEKHVLNMPLSKMDIVITSKLHGYSPKQGVAFEEFWVDHHEKDAPVPDMVHQDPIKYMDLLVSTSEDTKGSVVYEGPIIYVSLFAPYGQSDYDRVLQVIADLKKGKQLPPEPRDPKKMNKLDHTKNQKALLQQSTEGKGSQTRRLQQQQQPNKLGKRTNIMAIDARKHVDAIGECATVTAEQVGSCITDARHDIYKKGTRCFGEKGSHADLIAWDVIEAIHKLMQRPRPET
ncbi:expressed unknown protein [Seminavis robusta]|uniref:Uncharacterized protein n=1 Tax=Seminavis robusta TaxID=568900 RepID=A0A9N8HLH3_9STRA|nr:expressed unknown protein [Seminavis robusta]|eukprot:Sro1031_g233390.1 n/a (421) ;mRNA; f:4646-5908